MRETKEFRASAARYVFMVATCFGIVACGVIPLNFSARGAKYQYTYTMKASAGGGSAITRDPANLLFQDDNLIVQFRFDDAAIHFQLQNLTDLYVTLDLAKAFIYKDRRVYPLCHSLNFYSDTLARSVPVSLPPLGYTRDYVAPRENVYFDGSKWVEKDLFPSTDRNSDSQREAIKRQVGKTVLLTLPLMFGSSQKDYIFEFQVTSVTGLPWNKYQPPKRSPPPPQKDASFLALDQVTTGIIVAGLLGFSAFLLTLSKDTPADLK